MKPKAQSPKVKNEDEVWGTASPFPPVRRPGGALSAPPMWSGAMPQPQRVLMF